MYEFVLLFFVNVELRRGRLFSSYVCMYCTVHMFCALKGFGGVS